MFKFDVPTPSCILTTLLEIEAKEASIFDERFSCKLQSDLWFTYSHIYHEKSPDYQTYLRKQRKKSQFTFKRKKIVLDDQVQKTKKKIKNIRSSLTQDEEISRGKSKREIRSKTAQQSKAPRIEIVKRSKSVKVKRKPTKIIYEPPMMGTRELRLYEKEHKVRWRSLGVNDRRKINKYFLEGSKIGLT